MSINNNTTSVESTPTKMAAGSRILTVKSDTTDALGVRHVVIQTDATGNDREGYKAAERQAHEWFFANYNPIFPEADTETCTSLTGITAKLGLESGRITEDWLASSHPGIQTRNGAFRFGHHCGINPKGTEPTWGFAFEILPIGGLKRN